MFVNHQTYKHDYSIDVAIYVLKAFLVRPNYWKIKFKWINIAGEKPFNIGLPAETMTVKGKEEILKWRLYEGS